MKLRRSPARSKFICSSCAVYANVHHLPRLCGTMTCLLSSSFSPLFPSHTLPICITFCYYLKESIHTIVITRRCLYTYPGKKEDTEVKKYKIIALTLSLLLLTGCSAKVNQISFSERKNQSYVIAEKKEESNG